jgi:hypothetical protein
MLLSAHPELTPEQLEAWIESTPSRVANPDSHLADGKVGYASNPDPVRVIARNVHAAP